MCQTTRLAVAAHRLDGAADRPVGREILVRLGDPLAEPAVDRGERGVPAQQLQESLLLEDPVQQQLQPGDGRTVGARAARGHLRPVLVDVPSREVVQLSERRAVPGGDAVGDDGEHREPERHRELTQVGLQLGVRCRQVRCQAAGPLQLDDAHRHAVAVQDQVEAAVELAPPHGDLAGHQPVVVIGVRREQPDGRGLFLAVVVGVGDGAEAADQPVVDAVVLRDRVVRPRLDDLRKSLLQIVAGDLRVEPAQRVEQPRLEHEVVPPLPFTTARRDRLPSTGSQASSPRISLANCSQSSSDVPAWLMSGLLRRGTRKLTAPRA